MTEYLTTELYNKFIRFVIVGFSGLIVDFGITYFTKEKLKVQKYLANAIGFSTAATTNYFFNRIWTFQSTNPEILFEYGSFLLVSLVGLFLNTLILYLIVSRLKINFYISKAFAMMVVTLWNFSANAFITFSTEPLTASLF